MAGPITSKLFEFKEINLLFKLQKPHILSIMNHRGKKKASICGSVLKKRHISGVLPTAWLWKKLLGGRGKFVDILTPPSPGDNKEKPDTFLFQLAPITNSALLGLPTGPPGGVKAIFYNFFF